MRAIMSRATRRHAPQRARRHMPPAISAISGVSGVSGISRRGRKRERRHKRCGFRSGMSGKRERVWRSRPRELSDSGPARKLSPQGSGDIGMGGWHEPYGENGYSLQAHTPPPGEAQLAREQAYPQTSPTSPASPVNAWNGNGLADADTTLPARPAAPSWDQAYQTPTLPREAVNGRHPAGNGTSSNGAHGAAYAAAPGQITQIPQQRPSQGPARKGLDDDDEMNTTSRMARIARAPDYAQVQRKLASRRRTRSALSEIMLLLDTALSVAALMLVTHFQNRLPYLQVTIPFFRGLAFRASLLTPGQIAMLGLIVLTGWPVLLSLFGLYSSDWSANLFAPIKAAAVV